MPKLIRDLSPDERAEWVKLCPEFDRIGPDHPINGKMSWGEHSLPLALRPLANHNRWLVWKWVATDGGKLTKPPFQAAAGMRHAANNEPATWCDYARAKTYVDRGLAHGVGLVLTDFNVCAFDLDHCFAPDGMLYPSARDLVDQCASYTERTPSGDGLRILGTAIPDKKRQCVINMIEGWNLEVYEAGCARYVTVTGVPFEKERLVVPLGDIVAEHFKGRKAVEQNVNKEEPLDWQRFCAAVRSIPNDGTCVGATNWDGGLERDTQWVPLAACIFRTGHPDAWKLFLEFSGKSRRKFHMRDARALWRSLQKNPVPRTEQMWTAGSIYRLAELNNWNDPALGPPVVETCTAVSEQEFHALYPREFWEGTWQ